MKFNFYITAENAEEAQACIKFIDQMTSKRVVPKTSIDDESEEMNGGGVVSRTNVCPGEPAIGKIGVATQAMIFDDLEKGHQPPQPKYAEHMTLLWKRGMVKFDGTEYYL